ncbi:cell wall-binding repeat-containing protein [Kineococcus endophyticus]|uniref:Cell wall-binding repeat-containing protein n=1 Tax=Kineococcus endophyticus TaxID=1181883 RepID=A0ABV3P4I0_9ACTN
MTAATSRLRRRGIGAGVAALVGLSGLGFAAMPAQAAAGFDPAASQVSGVDRFDTAAQIAVKAFPGGSSTVVVANGDRAIDAQAGAYAAGLNNAPILLTQKSNVPAYTVNAIKTLKATKAIVLGDSNSVDATAIAQMTAAGLQVQVVSGSDRFATAAAIYNLGSTKSSTVFLARADLLAGQVSPDALAASPLSFDGTPVLLTNAGSLPSATANAITSGGVKNVVVLGNAITDSVKNAVTALGATVTTIAGDDRSLTAQKIAEYGVAQGKYGKTTATIANGDKIDALAAGPWAAKNSAPILLTLGTNSLGTGTTNYLTANASTLTTAVAFGDTNSVPASLSAAAKTAAGGNVTSLQTIAVSPSTSVTQTVVGDTGGTADAADDRVYTATGLTAGTTYRITLVNADSIRTAADGSVTFLTSSDQDSAGKNLVDPGADVADITSVNNATPTFPSGDTALRSTTVQPVNGSITFTVDGTNPGAVVPVVYINGGAGGTSSTGGVNGRLETSATTAGVYAAATENFGLGGAVVYVATRAANGLIGAAVDSGAGTATAATITAVDKTGNTFTATVDPDQSSTTGTLVARSFAFDANDTYTVGGVSVGFDTFKAALSAGDTITGNYTTDAGGVSSFALTDSNPVLTGTATATAGSGASVNDITLAATFGANSLDSVTIERAPSTSGVTATTGFVPVTTVTPTVSATSLSFVDNDVAAGSYTYRFTPINDGDPGTAQTANINVTSPAAVDSTAPTLINTVQTTSAGLAGSLDQGDVVKLVASEALAAPSSTSRLRVTDADGTIVDITNVSGNATFTLNSADETVGGVVYPANRVLTVTLLATQTSIANGTTAGVQLPATITDSASVTDVAGNALSLASGDRQIG